MRILQFRAWHKKTNRMSWKFYLGETDLTFNIDDGNFEIIKYHDIYPDLIVMQNTGRKDNHQKDIFEQDIVSTTKGICVICYDRNQVKYKAVPVKLYHANAGNGGWSGFDLSVVKEVIGNVYQNEGLVVV